MDPTKKPAAPAHRTNNDVVAELAAKVAVTAETRQIKRGTDDATEVLIVPEHMRVESIKRYLDENRTAPERRRGVSKLTDLQSFIAAVNRFKDAGSALFAHNSTPPRLECVFTYHPKGPADGPDSVRFGDHRAEYTFPLAEEWKTWTAFNGKPMSQAEFALFLENRLFDIGDPTHAFPASIEFAQRLSVSFASPQKLLELSRSLSIHIDRRVKNSTKLQSGEGQIIFTEEHTDEAGQPLHVPGAFLIVVRVFENGVPYQIPARLRYRVGGGQISWSYELYRPDRALDDAIKEACVQAEKDTGLPLFYGAPEA